MSTGPQDERGPKQVIKEWTDSLDRIISPDYRTWGPPQAPVAAWVAVHLAVVFVFLVIAGAGAESVAARVMAGGWCVVTSGLVARLARHLFLTSFVGGPFEVVSPQRWPRGVNAKSGAFLVASEITLLALRHEGRALVATFVAVVGLTLGVRVAGLDAWEGRRRPRWFYLRIPVTAGGIFVITLALIVVALELWGFALIIDPLVDRVAAGAADTWWFFDLSVSRREQYVEAVLAVAVVMPPTLLVCEALSLVAAYTAALDARLASQERSLQRATFAMALHDQALTLADEVAQRCSDDEHRRLALRLKQQLRAVQNEFEDPHEPRTVRDAIRRAAELANEFGIEVKLVVPPTDFDRPLAPEVAQLLERLCLNHVNNSSSHDASSAEMRISAGHERLVFWYTDDAGGFDITKDWRPGGGLDSVRTSARQLGGDLTFERRADRTIARAEVPLG